MTDTDPRPGHVATVRTDGSRQADAVSVFAEPDASGTIVRLDTPEQSGSYPSVYLDARHARQLAAALLRATGVDLDALIRDADDVPRFLRDVAECGKAGTYGIYSRGQAVVATDPRQAVGAGEIQAVAFQARSLMGATRGQRL